MFIKPFSDHSCRQWQRQINCLLREKTPPSRRPQLRNKESHSYTSSFWLPSPFPCVNSQSLPRNRTPCQSQAGTARELNTGHSGQLEFTNCCFNNIRMCCTEHRFPHWSVFWWWVLLHRICHKLKLVNKQINVWLLEILNNIPYSIEQCSFNLARTNCQAH